MTLELLIALLPDPCAIYVQSERVIGMKRNYAKERINDAPPIGMLPDGTLNIVERGAPRFEPRIISDQEAAEKEAAFYAAEAARNKPVSPKT